MEHHLKRVLNLVRKTGDTMIVVDKEGDDAFVVMDLDQYELIVDAQLDFEDEWPEHPESVQEQEQTPHLPDGVDIWDVMPNAGEETQTWDIDQLSNEEMAELERQYQAFASRHVQEAIEETAAPEPVEEVSAPSPEPETQENDDGDEYGEEQFYLEPVE